MKDVIIRIEPLKADSFTFHQLRARQSVWQVVAGSHSWCPPIDVYETDDQFTVRVEAAGMKEGEFLITLDKQLLLIEGRRPSLSETCFYHQMEIGFGEFRNGVELTSPVIAEQVTAVYEDGFLEVILPKQKSRRVEIKD